MRLLSVTQEERSESTNKGNADVDRHNSHWKPFKQRLHLTVCYLHKWPHHRLAGHLVHKVQVKWRNVKCYKVMPMLQVCVRHRVCVCLHPCKQWAITLRQLSEHSRTCLGNGMGSAWQVTALLHKNVSICWHPPTTLSRTVASNLEMVATPRNRKHCFLCTACPHHFQKLTLFHQHRCPFHSSWVPWGCKNV